MAFLTPHRDAGLFSEKGQHHELELGTGGAVAAQRKGHITSFDEIKEELACLLRAK